MAKTKKEKEIAKKVKDFNCKLILAMYTEGWCANCNENVVDCMQKGKCKGQEDLENVEKENI